MVRTYGLTHINVMVRDVERSLRFYLGIPGQGERDSGGNVKNVPGRR